MPNIPGDDPARRAPIGRHHSNKNGKTMKTKLALVLFILSYSPLSMAEVVLSAWKSVPQLKDKISSVEECSAEAIPSNDGLMLALLGSSRVSSPTDAALPDSKCWQTVTATADLKVTERSHWLETSALLRGFHDVRSEQKNGIATAYLYITAEKDKKTVKELDFDINPRDIGRQVNRLVHEDKKSLSCLSPGDYQLRVHFWVSSTVGFSPKRNSASADYASSSFVKFTDQGPCVIPDLPDQA